MAGHRKCNHEAVIADIRAGMSYKAVGSKYGLTASAVSRIAQRNGIQSVYVCHSDEKKKKIEADQKWVDDFCSEWDKITRRLLGDRK